MFHYHRMAGEKLSHTKMFNFWFLTTLLKDLFVCKTHFMPSNRADLTFLLYKKTLRAKTNIPLGMVLTSIFTWLLINLTFSSLNSLAHKSNFASHVIITTGMQRMHFPRPGIFLRWNSNLSRLISGNVSYGTIFSKWLR